MPQKSELHLKINTLEMNFITVTEISTCNYLRAITYIWKVIVHRKIQVLNFQLKNLLMVSWIIN